MRNRARGLTLIELMVALAIGSLLIVGAVFVYSQSRKTHTLNEVTARLQENARYVLSIIEPDLQLAGYYGFTNSPSSFTFMQGGAATAISSADMQPGGPAVGGLGTTHTCGNNFAVNLLASIEGSNDTYTLGCAANGGVARPNTDTLVTRRASINTALPTNGRLQVLANRLSTGQRLFADGNLPATPALAPGAVEVRDLIVRAYYISPDSTNQPGLPALRVKSLIGGGPAPAPPAPAFDDQEVMPGVEDIQVQFGIDTTDFNGVTTRYVNPDAVPAGAQVAAVRIWLMMRADRIEPGFTDNRPYQYANRNVTPNDSFRRVLVSRTIQLRNSRTL